MDDATLDVAALQLGLVVLTLYVIPALVFLGAALHVARWLRCR